MINKNTKEYGKELKIDVVIKYFLFILSPFSGLIYSLFRPNTKSSLFIFFLFGLVFGIAATVPPYTTLDLGAYLKKFEEVLSFTKVNGELPDLFNHISYYKDYYVYLIAYFSSKISDNYHLFFFILSIPFNLFAILSLSYFVKEKNKVNTIAFYILFAFFLTNHYFGINGVRFWTAAWIGIYIALKVFLDCKKKYIFALFFLPLIHGSFFFYILIVLITKLIIKLKLFRKNLFFTLFIISIIISSLGDSLIVPLIKKISFINQLYLETYLDQSYIQDFHEGRGNLSSLGNIFRLLNKIYINILFLTLLYNIDDIYKNKSKNLFIFLYIWIIFTNFVIFIPSLGERNMKMLMPIMAYIFIFNFRSIKFKHIIYPFPLIYLFEFYLAYLRYTTVLENDFYYKNFPSIIYKYFS